MKPVYKISSHRSGINGQWVRPVSGPVISLKPLDTLRQEQITDVGRSH
jgi:hypothetical protein